MQWSQISTWPNARLSRQVLCQPHRWHVQETGSGDTLLLLHGAGGSTHTYRALISLLSERFHVVALDLPGQGFTQLGARHRCGLLAMSEDIGKLCAQEGWTPSGLVGHSAGGALALDLAIRLQARHGSWPRVIGINAALDTFQGVAGVLFPLMAKVLASVPFTASLFSSINANPNRVKSLIASTGSVLSPEGLDLYRRLIADRAHVDGTLLMMAQWDLHALLEGLPEIEADTLFIVGDADKVVIPDVSHRAAVRMSSAKTVALPDLGHMCQEEDPQAINDLIQDFMGR